MQWRKLGRMKLVAANEPHRRRESLTKVKSPLIANLKGVPRLCQGAGSSSTFTVVEK
jgi:hypothetical protein